MSHLQPNAEGNRMLAVRRSIPAFRQKETSSRLGVVLLGAIACFLLSSSVLAQDRTAMLSSMAATEAKARANAGAVGENVAPNAADRFLLEQGARATSRTGPVSAFVVSLAASSGSVSGNAPSGRLRPPSLKATFHGHNPPANFCDFGLEPLGAPADDWYRTRQTPRPGCNDKTSGVTVPFGLQVRMCDHDGRGRPTPWGACHDFSPGYHPVPSSFNDKASSLWVFEVNEMYFYFTSASDEVPSSLTAGVFYEATTDDPGGGHFKVKFGMDQNWYTKVYELVLPSWCANPDVWETTKNNDASQTHAINNGVLRMELKVQPTAPFGATNWVGVGVRCKP
jgi:hypothetical protein